MLFKLLKQLKALLLFLTRFLRRPCKPKKFVRAPKEYFCHRESIKVISSSSVVLHVVTPEIDGYFFECRKHVKIKKYVTAFIDDYFSFYCDDYPEKNDDKKFILNSLKKPENFKKFIFMGRKQYAIDSGCMEFLNTGNAAAVGLETQDPQLIKRLQKFVGQYAWCQLNSFITNQNSATNTFENKEASAALATQEIAKLLKLDYMIPKANYVTLNIDNKKTLFGLFINTAEGCSVLPYKDFERKAKITPSLQRDLTNLNILDIITYEQDHSPVNYNVIMNDNGYITGISAFDNKSSACFPLHKNIDFVSFKNCSPIINKDGLINRPFLSKTTTDLLEALSLKDLYSALKNILTPIQILFTWKRISLLKDAIRKTAKVNSNFIISDNEWSNVTIEKELDETYGKTYLMSFYSDVFLYE